MATNQALSVARTDNPIILPVERTPISFVQTEASIGTDITASIPGDTVTLVAGHTYLIIYSMRIDSLQNNASIAAGLLINGTLHAPSTTSTSNIEDESVSASTITTTTERTTIQLVVTPIGTVRLTNALLNIVELA